MLHRADDGCVLSYVVDGPEQAPALVLSNSLGTTIDLWERQIKAFSQSFRVLRYDTRGHGKSDVPADGYSVERLGRDALSVMDAAGIPRAHVCGVSIGGVTALWLGVHAPDRVASLVLANTAARIGSRELWDDRIRLVRAGGLEVLVDGVMARWFTEEFREREPDTVARFRSTMVGMNVNGYLGCCAALRECDLGPQTPQVSAPTLIITGDRDVATPPAAGTWLREQIPGAVLVQLEAAHLPIVERADDFTAAVQRFLAA